MGQPLFMVQDYPGCASVYPPEVYTINCFGNCIPYGFGSLFTNVL